MLSLTSLAAVSLMVIAATNAEECSTSELLMIASSSHLEGCTSDVDFSGFSAITSLTEEQIKAVCDSSACMELMDDMRVMNFGNCIIQGTNISLDTDILDPFGKVCGGSGSVDLSASSVGDGSVGSGSSATSSATTAVFNWISPVVMVLAALAL